MYVRSSLSYELISLPLSPGFKSNVLCCRILTMSVIIIAVYHPYWSNNSVHQQFLDYLQECFDMCLTKFGKRHQLILCGDVNGLTQHYSSFLSSNNLNQIINFSTRGANTLDIFATTSSSDYLQPIKLSPLGRSDHAGFLVSSCCITPLVFQKVPTRDFSKSNHFRFHYLLLQINWQSVLNHESLDVAVRVFSDTVFSLFDMCFPVRLVRMRSDDPPWMTPYIKLLFDKMERSFFKCHRLHVTFREQFLQKVASAKEKFAHSMFSKSRNSRSTWQSINRITKRKPSHKVISDEVADQLSSTFANFFVSSDIHEADMSFLGCTIPSIFRVSELDVFRELKRIRSSSNGHDHIKGWLLKAYAHEFAAPFLFFLIVVFKNVTFLKNGSLPIFFHSRKEAQNFVQFPSYLLQVKF